MNSSQAILLAPVLDEPRLAHLRDLLPGAEERILSEDPAAISFSVGAAAGSHTAAHASPALRAELRAWAASQGLDLCWLPPALRSAAPGLFVLDVDSTFIEQEVIELIAEFAGTRAEVAAVTERAMRGEIDFAESLHDRVATLAGLPVSVLDEVRGRVRVTPGARRLVETVREIGGDVALVSGGFAEIVAPLAADYGITRVRANRLGVAGGRLTGTVAGPVVDRAAKREALREFAAELGVPLGRTVAMGDGANDLDMMEAAGLGIAFCAKPAVRARADTSVSFRRLDAALPISGVGLRSAPAEA